MPDTQQQKIGYPEELLNQAGQASNGNYGTIKKSKMCVCYYCCTVFPVSQVEEADSDNATVWCPHCSIDSVYGDASGLPMADDFIKAMHARSFWEDDMPVTRIEPDTLL